MTTPGTSGHEAESDTELTLTSEFTEALDLLHSGKNLYLTGKAGTGKSTLIRYFLAHTDRVAITAAPTGIAALNVGGFTIHRLFSFTPDIDEQTVRSRDYFPRRFNKAIKGLETLIIDEASMVRADLFDVMAIALERFGPHPGQPFGGVQLVLVGDLYQLPPVLTEHEYERFEQNYATPYFFSAHHFDPATFPTIELTTVFRQAGDDHLVTILNGVRDGALLDHARQELNAHVDPDFEPDPHEYWLTLATTNRIVGARNRRMLDKLGTPQRTFIAETAGQLDGFELPADSELTLAVGAQVMMLNNESHQRWVNGSIGRITAIRDDDDGATVIDVQLRGGKTVAVRRNIWEITRPVVVSGHVEYEVVGTFTQFPMNLAWAITIHKSQGQTLDHVVVDLSGGTFANGQLYVALSRCTSLSGIVLRRPVQPRDLKTDIRVRRFLNSATRHDEPLGRVYIAALCVGRDGDFSRPRPVEIAVVTDSGDEATTVVNPMMDLYSAQTQYGIKTRDVQLAPRLAEAWAGLSPLLAGRIPMGVQIDRTLGLIDSELKRNDIMQLMPLGILIPEDAMTDAELMALASGNALDRARAMQQAGERLVGHDNPVLDTSGGSEFPTFAWGSGYLQARTDPTTGTLEPDSFTVGGGQGLADDPAAALQDHLVAAWSRVVDPDETVVENIRRTEKYYGISVIPPVFSLHQAGGLDDIFCVHARVCFTGEVNSEHYGPMTRDQIQQLARDHGLDISATMTKTRTDVLVVAERGSQSGKAKKARQWNKPVVSADDFLEWVHAH